MERLMGKDVDVCLKFDEVISGMLFDTDNNHVYIQTGVDEFIVIPKENIKYYVSRGLRGSGKLITESTPEPPQEKGQELNVYVDDLHVANIAVPDEVNLMTCNDQVLSLVWSDESVKRALHGRIQKMLEYDIGEVRITTNMPGEEGVDPVPENAFDMSMGGGGQEKTPYDMLKQIGDIRRK